jgi:hypothetical protein
VKVRIQIDEPHSKKLLSGEPVVIKVPDGATTLEIRLVVIQPSDFVKAIDVFLKGRPA